MLLFFNFLAATACCAQDVKIQFFTPSIVHVVKGQPTKSLVITAQAPSDSSTGENTVGGQWKSRELTIKQTEARPRAKLTLYKEKTGGVFHRSFTFPYKSAHHRW
jgi:alpha-D-xyloside xylohydrolase